MTAKRKANQTKLVFTGSVGAGKTTAIGTISDVPPVTTEARPSEASVLQMKSSTTIAMDYGELTLLNGHKLHLYGTPGQRRFDFMCQILTKGALGTIILINNSLDDPLAELDYYLQLNSTFLKEKKAVVGVTHYDVKQSPSLKAINDFLHQRGTPWPVVRADSRSRESVVMLIDTLLATLEYS